MKYLFSILAILICASCSKEFAGEPVSSPIKLADRPCFVWQGWNVRMNSSGWIYEEQQESSAYIYNPFTDTAYKVANFQPLGWAGADLIGRGRDGFYKFTTKNGHLKPFSPLNVTAINQSSIRSKGNKYKQIDWISGRALYVRKRVPDEYLIVDYNTAEIHHFQLPENLSEEKTLKARLFENHSARLMLTYQSYLGPENVLFAADVWDFTAQELVTSHSFIGLEARYRAIHKAGNLFLRAREDNFLCGYWQHSSGQKTAAYECPKDVSYEVFDGTEIKALHLFDQFDSVYARNPEQSQRPIKGSVGKVIDSDLIVSSGFDANGLFWLATYDADSGEHISNSRVNFCGRTPVLSGVRVSAYSDGFDITGFLFTPLQRPSALVVMLHGGPYQTYTDLQGDDVQTLLANGYAIVFVNVRGTPGYGRAFLEAGFANGASQHLNMIADAAAVAREVRKIHPELASQKTVLWGTSWGGFLGLLDQAQDNPLFDLSVIQSGVCDISLSKTNVVFSKPDISITNIGNPDVAAFQLAIFGGDNVGLNEQPSAHRNLCSVKYQRPENILVLHGNKDTRAPIKSIEQMLSQNPEIRRLILDQGTHFLQPKEYNQAIREFISKTPSSIKRFSK